MHFFVQFVRNHVPAGWRPGSGGWISGNCPVCVHNGEARPDKKGRGGFHFDDDEWVYHCFNCGYTTGWKAGSHIGGKVKKLMKHIGVDEADMQRASLELLREEETTNLLNPIPEEPEAFVPNWPDFPLPPSATMMLDIDEEIVNKNFFDAVTMLHDRKLLHWTDWAYSSDIKFRKRIILPYRYKGNIVGYSARYIGKPPNTDTPKYIVKKPPQHVFNLDRQTADRSAVVVVEGDYDAINIDGVALGSNSLSAEQASLINQLNKKTILLPDADAAGKALIEPAIKQGWYVAFPEWMEEFKDANAASIKYGRAFVLQSVLLSAIDNPTKIRVLAKKYLRDRTNA